MPLGEVAPTVGSPPVVEAPLPSTATEEVSQEVSSMQGMERTVIRPTLAAVLLVLVITFAWFGLAIAAHDSSDDPLCGRACFNPGQSQTVTMNGGD